MAADNLSVSGPNDQGGAIGRQLGWTKVLIVRMVLEMVRDKVCGDVMGKELVGSIGDGVLWSMGMR
jgi:hypothetical protein